MVSVSSITALATSDGVQGSRCGARCRAAIRHEPVPYDPIKIRCCRLVSAPEVVEIRQT
jgi:hypothetical protein